MKHSEGIITGPSSSRPWSIDFFYLYDCMKRWGENPFVTEKSAERTVENTGALENLRRESEGLQCGPIVQIGRAHV